ADETLTIGLVVGSSEYSSVISTGSACGNVSQSLFFCNQRETDEKRLPPFISGGRWLYPNAFRRKAWSLWDRFGENNYHAYIRLRPATHGSQSASAFVHGLRPGGRCRRQRRGCTPVRRGRAPCHRKRR